MSEIHANLIDQLPDIGTGVVEGHCARRSSSQDWLPAMDEGSRAAYDEVLMAALSACVLQERFKLTARLQR